MPGHRIVFLDGIGCNPEGFKPRFLSSLGYQVTAPVLPDKDLREAVRLANAAVAQVRPNVIMGYSRGASVSLLLDDRTTPRLLVAPALHWLPDNVGLLCPTIILHSATDDGLPLDSVRDHLSRCAMTIANLRVVGDDHTMIDSAALKAMEAALAELTTCFHDQTLIE